MSSRGHSSKAVDSWEALKAVKILQTAKKAGIVSGTNPVCVAALALEGEMLTQKDAAEAAGVGMVALQQGSTRLRGDPHLQEAISIVSKPGPRVCFELSFEDRDSGVGACVNPNVN